MPKGVFSGLTICVSGAFDGMSQAEVKKAVTSNGGTISSTCTKSTDYVLAAALGTGKAGRAEDLGIPVCGQEWLEASIADDKISTKASHYLYKPDGGKATAKAGAKARTGKKGSDDESASDEDDTPKKKKAAAKKKKADMSDGSDEDDDGSDDGGKKKGTKRKAAPASSGKTNVFKGLTFAVSGKLNRSQDAVKTLLAANGGTLAASVTAAVTHVLSFAIGSSKTQKAADKGLPVVTEDWLDDCISAGKLLTEDKYYLANSPSGKVGKGSGGGGGGGSDDDDGSGDDEPKKKKVKAAPKKSAKKKGSDDDDDDDGSGGDDDDKPAKKSTASGGGGSGGSGSMKKTIMKGSVPVDETNTQGQKEGHVLEEKGCIWDAMLNQTNIGNNNNKFYVIQIIESDKGGSYWVWNRWGRVGATGQKSYTPCGSDLNKAKKLFESKFRDKTKNAWSARDNFKAHSGKYTLLERDTSIADKAKADAEEEDEKAGSASGSGGSDKPKKNVASQLDQRVQDLVSLICDVEAMKKTMIEVGYDAKKLPLGKLSKQHVLKGYKVLKEISDLVDDKKSNRAALLDLSNQFYTLIPHNVGFKAPPVIDNRDLLKSKLAMVEALGDLEIATKLLDSKGDDDLHPIDRSYVKLKCTMQPLEKDSPDFNVIQTYVKNTHASTHTAYSLDVEEAYALDREGEKDKFNAWEKNSNRQLLWHGSRLTNFVGILSQGLRIAPPEAPVTGYMFGKGVYFADMVSKSANYCCTSRDNNTGLLLLCEVALGPERELFAADYYAGNLPAGHFATKGVGSTHPDPAGAIVFDNGCKVPCGKGVPAVTAQPTVLLYNEFIVYDTAQIRMRYLVRTKFNYK